MSIGIMGAHRVGKSTLAELLSNETDYGFIQTNVSHVFEAMGLHPAEPMDFVRRIMVQNAILSHCEDMWALEKDPFFTDRTPLCMLAYTTADLTADVKLSDPEYNAYMEYRKRCFDSTHRFFGQLLLIQPGIEIVDDSGKLTAALNRSFIEQLNTIMVGLAHASECYTPVYVMPRKILDLEERKTNCIQAILHAYSVQDAKMNHATIN